MATKKLSKKAQAQRKKKMQRFGYAFVLVILAAIAGLAWQFRGSAQPLSVAGPLSRQVMSYQQTIVMEVKPPPTMSALQYAYVASAYNDALVADGQAGALKAAGDTLEMLYPAKVADVETHIKELASANNVTLPATASPNTVKVIQTYKDRYTRDGHDLVWDGVIPKGPGKWVKMTAVDPFTPRAGEWKRWNVTAPITVPAPPVYGSEEDLKQVSITKEASATRTGQDVNTINFWGGTPGPAAPSGIWQNQLYKTVQKELPNDAVKADREYAYVQKVLAQSMSDAFMECWKVKFTYWTARPNMRDPSIVTAMPNPNFPSYVSGHSTISKAAADVLAVMVPKHAADWQAMAVEARNSRLKAGIHFEVDNMVGFDVGANVAAQTIANQKLHVVLK